MDTSLVHANFLNSFVFAHGNGDLLGDEEELSNLFFHMEESFLIKIQALKDRGNVLFKQNYFDAASVCYDKACRLICFACGGMDDDFDVNSMADLAVSLNLNLAACAIKLQEHEAAKNLCSLVLNSFPKNVKALFRRAVAFMKSKMFLDARLDLENALMVEPKNKDILRELSVVKNLLAINSNGKRSVDEVAVRDEIREGKRPIPNLGTNYGSLVDGGCSSGGSCVSPIVSKDICNNGGYDGDSSVNHNCDMNLDSNFDANHDCGVRKLLHYKNKKALHSHLRISTHDYQKLLEGKEVSYYHKSQMSTMKIRILHPAKLVMEESSITSKRRKKRRRTRRKKRRPMNDVTMAAYPLEEFTSQSSCDLNKPLVYDISSKEGISRSLPESINHSTSHDPSSVVSNQHQPLPMSSTGPKLSRFFKARKQSTKKHSQGDESPRHNFSTFSSKFPRLRDVSVSCCRYSREAQIRKKRKELSSHMPYSTAPLKKPCILSSPTPSSFYCINNVVVASDSNSHMCFM